MAEHRTRKQKETPHYQFLVSWSPTRRVYDPEGSSQASVKGEPTLSTNAPTPERVSTKRAYLLAKDDESPRIKKDIIRSLILVSFILILEVVVYLALHRV